MRVFFNGSFKRKTTATVSNCDNLANTIYNTAYTSLAERLKASKCELCGSEGNIEIHHVKKNSKDRAGGGAAAPGAWICIGFGAASSSLLVWQTFALNARYGEHGLMKLGAARSHPRYLINRRRITRLFKRQRKEERQ